MNRQEFGRFLHTEVDVIKAYIDSRHRNGCCQSDNELALEWISRYAKSFRDDWDELSRKY